MHVHTQLDIKPTGRTDFFLCIQRKWEVPQNSVASMLIQTLESCVLNL
jgi:hypothetical protein